MLIQIKVLDEEKILLSEKCGIEDYQLQVAQHISGDEPITIAFPVRIVKVSISYIKGMCKNMKDCIHMKDVAITGHPHLVEKFHKIEGTAQYTHDGGLQICPREDMIDPPLMEFHNPQTHESIGKLTLDKESSKLTFEGDVDASARCLFDSLIRQFDAQQTS